MYTGSLINGASYTASDQENLNEISGPGSDPDFVTTQADSERTGTSGPWGVPLFNAHIGIGTESNFSNNYTNFSYCMEAIDTLPRLYNDYAILQLSPDCPVNSQSFARYSSNRSSGNSSSGDLFPPSSYTTGDDSMEYYSQMYFCYVKGDSATTAAAPWQSRGMGALTNASDTVFGGCNTYHWEVNDNNNVNNKNHYIWTPGTASDSTRIKEKFFNGAASDGTTDTHYFWNSCP